MSQFTFATGYNVGFFRWSQDVLPLASGINATLICIWLSTWVYWDVDLLFGPSS